MVVRIGVVEGADHEAGEKLALRGHAVVHENELSIEQAPLKHQFVHHFYK